MTSGEIVGRLIAAVIVAVIARQYKTREKAAAAFAKLELDWISGVGMALIIVLCAVLFGVYLGKYLGPSH